MILALFHCHLLVNVLILGGVRVTHCICLTTPLQCEQQSDNTWNQYTSSQSIQLRELLCPWELGCVPVRHAEAHRNQDHGHASKGQIDIEAPSPGDVGCKGTADQRAQDRSEAEESAKHAYNTWASLQRDGIVDTDNLQS